MEPSKIDPTKIIIKHPVMIREGFSTESPDKLAASIKAEKPKRSKPRRIVREIIVRLGKYQFVLTIWKFRKP